MWQWSAYSFANNSLHAICYHLFITWNVICHFITHSLHRSSQSAFVFTLLNHPVSSVNIVSFLLIPWSFMIKVAPYYIYCGSLLLTFSLSDYWPFIPSLLSYFLRQLFKNVMTFPFVQWQLNFSKNLWEGTLSNIC